MNVRFIFDLARTFMLTVCVGVIQQVIAAMIYGIFAYPYHHAHNMQVTWLDYVEEYLIWQIRSPIGAMTWTQIVSNALALIIVIVGGILLYQVIR